MTTHSGLTPAKRKRLLKTFGACPAGYTTKELEQLLDLLYGMFSHAYTLPEIRQIMISDPFDRSEHLANSILFTLDLSDKLKP